MWMDDYTVETRAASLRLAVSPPIAGAASVPGWTMATAVGALIALVGGWTVAEAYQPHYDWMAQSISDLAGYGATDRWIMTAAFVVMGLCQIATAIGLRAIRLPARLMLAIGGAATVLVAGCPVPPAGGSLRHGIVATVASTTVALFSLVAFPRDAALPWTMRSAVRVPAVVYQLALLAVYIVVLQQTGAWSGLLERIAACSESLWVLAVVAACRLGARVEAPATTRC
jgi:hypothetical membrane protein